MADVALSKVLSRGVFEPSFFSGSLQVAIGASGNVITITPPAGMRARLTGLAAANVENDISVIKGSTKVVDNKILSNIGNNSQLGLFMVGDGMASGGTGGTGTQILSSVTGEIDEVITVVKEAGVTDNIVRYSFAYGD